MIYTYVFFFGRRGEDSKPEDKSKSKLPAISKSGSTKQLYMPQAKAKMLQ